MLAAQAHAECPRCSAQLDPAQDICWLCGADIRIVEPATNPYAAPTAFDPPAGAGTTGLLIIFTLCLAIVGLSIIAPGFGVVGTFFLLPVLVRTYMVVRKREAYGETVSWWKRAWMFFTSLIVAYVVFTVVAFAAFGAFCAACFATMSANPDAAVIVACGAGIAAAIAVAFLMGYWVYARYRRATAPPAEAREQR